MFHHGRPDAPSWACRPSHWLAPLTRHGIYSFSEKSDTYTTNFHRLFLSTHLLLTHHLSNPIPARVATPALAQGSTHTSWLMRAPVPTYYCSSCSCHCSTRPLHHRRCLHPQPLGHHCHPHPPSASCCRHRRHHHTHPTLRATTAASHSLPSLRRRCRRHHPALYVLLLTPFACDLYTGDLHAPSFHSLK
jgi:hypothetical protein